QLDQLLQSDSHASGEKTTADLDQEEIEKYEELLTDDTTHPYHKTMVLQFLHDQNIENTIKISKFGKKTEIQLSSMVHATEDPLLTQVTYILENALESNNPTVYQMALELWKHFFFMLFPFDLSAVSPSGWAGAIDYL